MSLRRFIEKYTTNPIRGVGRILRGNVRQGLRDIAPSAKVAAAFIPGGLPAAAALGATAGALEQGPGASAKDFARGAVGGAATGMAGQAFVRGAPGLSNIFTGAGTPAAGISGAGSTAGKFVGGKGMVPKATGATGWGAVMGNINRNLPIYSTLAEGALGAYGSSEDRRVREEEARMRQQEQERRYMLDREQFEFQQSMALRAQELADADRARRQRVAQMLAPMLQEALRRQANRPTR